MTLKDFAEEAEVEYIAQVYVNGVLSGTVKALSDESLQEQLRKLDTSVKDELYRQYEELPESEIEND